MNKLKSLVAITVFFILSLIQITICKPQWVKVGDNWRYELHEGTKDYVQNKWRAILEDGIHEKIYYFDYYGNMATGPVVINSVLYVYGDDGAAVTTGFDIDGVHYETDSKGKVLGLPQFYDLSRFKFAVTDITFNINEGSATAYDNNLTAPTAAVQ